MIELTIPEKTRGWIVEVKRWLDDDGMREFSMRPTYGGIKEYKKRLRNAADTLPKDQRHSSSHYAFEGSLPEQFRG